MSEQKLELALAFLQSHPDTAATILEQLPAGEVTNLLQDVPHRIAAAVLERMLPQYTARLCKLLPPAQCAALFALMNFSTVAAILRYTNSENRKLIIDLLPEQTRLACLILLNYAEDTVGAWMIIQAASVAIDSTVGAALKTLIDQDDLALIDSIFVVDRNRLVLGELSYAVLLRANPELPIAALLQAKSQVIQGRTKLETAIKLDIWEHRDSVAVVNRQNQFVGVLRHVDLRRGMAQVANVIETPVGSDPITSLLSVYGSILFSLLDTVGTFATKRNQ